MIAFGTSIANPAAYRHFSEPGIRAVAEADSRVLVFAGVGSISRSYNLLLDAAAELDNLEALVIVHPHTEIADQDFCAKVRDALADPGVGVVGYAGATGVRTLAWWEGAMTAAPIRHRYFEYGGGELPAFGWTAPAPPPAEVDVVDGSLLVLSPRTVRTLRFDEGLRMNHGFDVDFCLQARAAGARILVADLHAVHHHSLELVPDLNLWMEAHQQVAEKWAGRMPGAEGGAEEDADAAWKERARRAEAEREVARAVAHGNTLDAEARIAALERQVEAATRTFSWRSTKPLRRLNRLRTETKLRLRRRESPWKRGPEPAAAPVPERR